MTAASPAIIVNDSRLWSQNSVFPPKPRSLIMDRANANPCRSASSATFLFSSNDGMYCGAFSEISQPLFPIGRKTPKSMNVPHVRCIREKRYVDLPAPGAPK